MCYKIYTVYVEYKQWLWGYYVQYNVYGIQHKQPYSLYLRKFVNSNLPHVGFEL